MHKNAEKLSKMLKMLITVADFLAIPYISQNIKRRASERLQTRPKVLTTLKKSLKTLRTGPYSGRDARVHAGILTSFTRDRASLLYGV